MAVRKIKEDIFSVGAIDWDRRLFDELIPLPDGTSYNSYLIKGSEKIALIDTVDPPMKKTLFDNLDSLGIKNIDYIISNHAEQDHSGSIPLVLERFKNARVVTNQKCKDLLIKMLHIDEGIFDIIKDGDTISLGNKTLEFLITPWVHWPETMVTYLREDNILFSCDFFGSHLATSPLYVEDECEVYESAKRYFAEIMMPFSRNIKKHLEKLKDLSIDIIAPSHGPIHKKPEFIIEAYKDWISDDVKNEVIIPYVSMHGSTGVMVDYLVNALIRRGITVKPFNLTETDIGELAVSLVDAATIVIGSPTVLAGPHPSAIYAAFLANALRPKVKFASLIGSFGWGGRMVEIISDTIKNLNVEIIEPVIIKGYPRNEDFSLIDNLAEEILKKHKSIDII